MSNIKAPADFQPKKTDIPGMLEEIASEICDHYCKFSEQWNEEDGELMDSAICNNCPLVRFL